MEPLDYSIFPEKQVVYAPFWHRFGAAFLDGILITIATRILNYVIFKDAVLVSLVVQILITWLYSALQESGPNMATVGKRALRIKVTDLNDERISFARASGRYFSKNIALVGFFWLTIAYRNSPDVIRNNISTYMITMLVTLVLFCFAYLMMLWDSKSQALHDKLAGTLVVKE
jgi:uncharacterized RDD family membrane protein YckC